jgi:hypothetical protein
MELETRRRKAINEKCESAQESQEDIGGQHNVVVCIDHIQMGKTKE